MNLFPTTEDALDINVFRKYAGLSLPRHVSYPMPTAWYEIMPGEADAMIRESAERESAPDLSLYFHIPFCEALCRFCACNRVILKPHAKGVGDRVEAYVAALEHEIVHCADQGAGHRSVRQIHFGGGTPTYLSMDQLGRMMTAIRSAFALAPDAEVAMEVDPRKVGRAELEQIKGFGFNRLSFGIQDFDEQVQEHMHRVQPFEMVREIITICRDLRFPSINFDLIYGLPYQTMDTVRDAIEKTIELAPDRIAFYHYAQIPEKIATQRGLDHTKSPDSETKLTMFLMAIDRFQAAGYDFIGLDHFAKPSEGLGLALRNGTLERNFQGMTTGAGLDLLGFGASAISHLRGIGFIQNVHDTDDYPRRIRDTGAAVRGKRLSLDDRIRQAVLSDLYCYCRIDPARIESAFDITFADYFARELVVMNELAADGLVSLEANGGVGLTDPLGRVLVRNVGAVFDAYLEPDAYRVGDRRCFSANA